MRWTERQRAMLREMGIRLWSRPETSTDEAEVGAVAEAAVEVAAARAAGPSLASAEWLVVGEAFDAGDDSAADQERLLDNMLAAVGVARAAPTRQRRATFLALPARSPAEGGGWAALLQSAFDSVQPACVLALGRNAAQALLDTDEPLGALRGRRESRAGVPVVVTFPPAYLLRHPAEKAKAWADLCLAVRCADEAVAAQATV
jgi:uracil-DNA glycosylase family 4